MYKYYLAEQKLALIKEFQSRNISMRAFCKEKKLGLSTFDAWLKKVRRHGLPSIEAFKENSDGNSLTPIDVTSDVKEIVHDMNPVTNNIFTLEIKGIKLTFAVANLKDVLEVIK